MRPLLAFCLAVMLAGCAGESEVERRGTPAQATPTPAATPAPRVELAAGQTGVVGLDGRGGVRPDRLEFARDASLERIRWTAWDAGRAAGAGTLRLLECDPSCAQGTVRRARAEVRLSQPVQCPSGRFFARAEVTPAGGGPRPAAYVEAPC